MFKIILPFVFVVLTPLANAQTSNVPENLLGADVAYAPEQPVKEHVRPFRFSVRTDDGLVFLNRSYLSSLDQVIKLDSVKTAMFDIEIDPKGRVRVHLKSQDWQHFDSIQKFYKATGFDPRAKIDVAYAGLSSLDFEKSNPDAVDKLFGRIATAKDKWMKQNDVKNAFATPLIAPEYRKSATDRLHGLLFWIDKNGVLNVRAKVEERLEDGTLGKSGHIDVRSKTRLIDSAIRSCRAVFNSI